MTAMLLGPAVPALAIGAFFVAVLAGYGINAAWKKVRRG